MNSSDFPTVACDSVDDLIQHFFYLDERASLGHSMAWSTAAMEVLTNNSIANKAYLDLQQLWEQHGEWMAPLTSLTYHHDQHAKHGTVVLDFLDAEYAIATELYEHPDVTTYGKTLLEAYWNIR